MVVDDGVHERGPDQRAVVVTAVPGAVSGGALVLGPGRAADEPVPAPVGDVAALGDIEVDQRTRVVVLVTAQRLAGDSVNV